MRAVPEGWVRLGEVAREAGEQCQTLSMLIVGQGSMPRLGDGLRIEGDRSDYHSMLVHKDDAGRLLARVRQWQQRFEDRSRAESGKDDAV